MLSALMFLIGQLMEEVAHTLQSHILAMELKAHDEVCVGVPQMHVDHVVDVGFHLGGIILTNLGGHVFLGIRS